MAARLTAFVVVGIVGITLIAGLIVGLVARKTQATGILVTVGLAVGALLIPLGAFVPPVYQSLVMVPIGLAVAWLGYALWSERTADSALSGV